MPRHNEIGIKDAINSFLKDYGLRDRFLQTKVVTEWPEIMGASISKHTMDIYVKENKLFLYLDSGPLKHELNQSKQLLIKRVNDVVGADLIKEIIIR